MRVDRDTVRLIQGGGNRGTTVAELAHRAGSRDGGDATGRGGRRLGERHDRRRTDQRHRRHEGDRRPAHSTKLMHHHDPPRSAHVGCNGNTVGLCHESRKSYVSYNGRLLATHGQHTAHNRVGQRSQLSSDCTSSAKREARATTALDALDCGPVPRWFSAATRNV